MSREQHDFPAYMLIPGVWTSEVERRKRLNALSPDECRALAEEWDDYSIDLADAVADVVPPAWDSQTDLDHSRLREALLKGAEEAAAESRFWYDQASWGEE